MRIITSIVVLMFLTGCKQPSPTDRSVQTQNEVSVKRIPSDADLAAQMSAYAHLKYLIAHADRIVAVSGAREHAIPRKEAKNILRAISSATLAPSVDSDSEWDLKFYRGTNFSASVRIMGELFMFEHEYFYDSSAHLSRSITTIWSRGSPELDFLAFKPATSPSEYLRKKA